MKIQQVDVLAFGAHPDDVELGCGATLAKLIEEGKKVAIVDFTQGELGTRGTPELRLKEADAAAKMLGVSFRENLGMPDGYLENTKEYQLQIVECIRAYRPSIVLANPFTDRHPDHGRAAHLVRDAVFLSGLRKVETFREGVLQAAYRPKHLFHYIQWKHITPDFVIDISSFLEKKKEVCLCYASQFYNPNSSEPTTPITTKDFLESITYRAQDLGRLTGVAFAEGFLTENLVAHKNFDNFL